MVIYDLVCKKNHHFEGWFPSFESFQEQASKEQIFCPVCGSRDVERKPHACALVKRRDVREDRPEKPKQEKTATVPVPETDMKEALLKLHHYVREHFEDVGPNFAKEARAIFRGESDKRSIFGTSTLQEREDLDEEGVPYAILPKPDLDS